jgi:hypothetical protein
MLLGSTVLEVAVGLFFVYLLLSLLCSAITEYVEAKFNNRAKYLQRGIALLLNDTDGRGADLAKQLYEHGLVRPFYRDGNRLPSYIPSRTFSLALWNLATTAAANQAGGTQAGAADGGPAAGVINDLQKIRAVVATSVPNRELRTALLTLIDEADGDIAKARKNIEEWYEAMMDRVAGWYKRSTSVLLLILGFAIAALVNADTISIARTLARDGALRSSIVGAAQQRLETPLQTAAANGAQAGGPDSEAAAEARERVAADNLRQARADIDALGLPLGWAGPSADRNDPRRLPADPFEWLLKILGIALTGLAVSQGAPFWFDILNKFIVIRSTVKPAEKSQTQPSKDRPAPTTETETPQEPETPNKG